MPGADGVVSVERYLHELRRSGRQNPGSLGPVRQSAVADVPTGVVTVQSTLHRATIVAVS